MMLGNPGIYAAKKRKKPVQKPKKLPGVDGVVKSNPSKRHRDRLNGELDRLTDLLPFPEDIRSRLDKLSVLRLSVGYLRAKNFFKATMKKSSVMFPRGNGLNGNGMDTSGFSEGDLLLQVLNGFVMVITAEGLVFYVSHTIQDYLGFHQSDVIHQSVYELIHTDDRALFRQQLHFALNPKPMGTDQDGNVMQCDGDTVKYDPEQLPPENSSFLERNFVCRLRCLLDNSSGFLALTFQGRLKYLHGQSVMSSDGSRIHPQLALFAIATPVQPPSILEIRTKTLIFQTKHKLDFTPTGVDTRGKVILGYSEIELCMKGSGYQFIHAADMMYCADNHVRMIKTGESGMTVFRLLTKSGSWLWVQANAKLVYKNGRPDFIIARQRALVNAEGENHLRQRRLQLPFGFTTGEALLYETGPTLDIASHFSEFGSFNSKAKEDVDPGSLLGCFLSQDKNVYTQTVEPTVPEDQVFTDTWALLNVPSKMWQDDQPIDGTDGPAPVKAEAEQSVVAMIDTLEKMAQDGGLCEALQGLEVNPAELMEWENALMKLSQDNDQQNTMPELDSILTSDIFAYMDSVLFKEANLNTSQPTYLETVTSNQDESFGQAVQPSAAGLCEPQLFQRPSTDHTPAPVNGLCAQQQAINNGPVSTGQTFAQPAQIFNNTQKLSHYGPPVLQSDASAPSLQQLQLEDIFSPLIELPELSLPAISGNDVPFESRGQVSVNHMACQQGIPGQTQSNQLQQFSVNGMQTPPGAANGQLLQSCVPQPNAAAPSVLDNLPSLIPCNDFSSPNESSTQRAPIPFPTACLQGNAPFQTHNNHRIQQWPHTQQQKLPPASVTQNGHKPIPACHSQVPSSQRFPPAGIWPRSINGVNHTQQGGLADGQAAPPSSCMFEKHSLPLPNGTGVTPSSSSCQRGNDGPLDQSPTQASCYFQVGRSEPVVGTSVIIQESASISPPSHPLQLDMSSPQDLLVMQRYLEYNEQTQQNSRLPAESNGLFAVQPLGDINMYFPEQTQTNCCNF
ncbi:aryl hydrocarbon receptor-like isoform X1 [Myripristis murdjan]|uniref:aryl hydrocarbon receptor-like isoform X1 n=1 Tax=Myripristis murdjan TaxID=586833 RepID=UPI0011763636|nr:aryl hydrocarbon receptor-like isoform X1 [Myripristis murdjan]